MPILKLQLVNVGTNVPEQYAILAEHVVSLTPDVKTQILLGNIFAPYFQPLAIAVELVSQEGSPAIPTEPDYFGEYKCTSCGWFYRRYKLPTGGAVWSSASWTDSDRIHVGINLYPWEEFSNEYADCIRNLVPWTTA